MIRPSGPTAPARAPNSAVHLLRGRRKGRSPCRMMFAWPTCRSDQTRVRGPSGASSGSVRAGSLCAASSILPNIFRPFSSGPAQAPASISETQIALQTSAFSRTAFPGGFRSCVGPSQQVLDHRAAWTVPVGGCRPPEAPGGSKTHQGVEPRGRVSVGGCRRAVSPRTRAPSASSRPVEKRGSPPLDGFGRPDGRKDGAVACSGTPDGSETVPTGSELCGAGCRSRTERNAAS